MIGEKGFDCQEMFVHACTFAECADMAMEKYKPDNKYDSWFAAVAATNSGFSCEVFLKALLKYYDVKCKREHGLKELFELLPDTVRRDITKATLQNYCGVWREDMQLEFLNNISKVFSTWRYIYEFDCNQNKKVYLEHGFLDVFRNTLREYCSRLLFGMPWEQYKVLKPNNSGE